RARRPEPFAGAYRPVETGPGVCAYLRGDDVLVVVPVRAWKGAVLALDAAERWRDVLTGEERELGPEAAVADLVARYGVALLERG
ncbi:MAG TPA: hypothetical protein VN751_06830, partial [Solirubrobacteraceae bacterium]|nr:hypothetical protein [Solirubrobacteraceae bacterium]